MNRQEREKYEEGRAANRSGRLAGACPHLDGTEDAAFYCAGWHDEDMERGNTRYFDNNRRAINERRSETSTG